MLEGYETLLYFEDDRADRSLWRGRGKRMGEERFGSRDGGEWAWEVRGGDLIEKVPSSKFSFILRISSMGLY